MPSETFERLNLEKKTRILTAARKEFSEKVYEEAKVVTICKNAEIPRMTFYSYFATLSDLYEYLYKTISKFYMLGSITDCQIGTYDADWEEYYMKLIESEQGQRILYQSMQSAPLKERMLHHIIQSLTRQYKLGLLTREDYISEFSQMKVSLFAKK
jgi:AcrR family transcriptional regulator